MGLFVKLAFVNHQVHALLIKRLRLTQNAVDLGATRRADALCHATTRIGDLNVSLKGTLLLALHAIGFAFVFLWHIDPPIVTLSKPRVLPGASVRTSARYPRTRSERGIWSPFCAYSLRESRKL